jgi:hypothetical protein
MSDEGFGQGGTAMYISVGGGGPGSMVAVQRVRTVVVYDAASGRIVHTHHAVTFTGGKPLSDDELKARALKLAHGTGTVSGRKIPTRLEALHVDPASIASGVEYKVDPKQRTLVAGKRIAAFAERLSGHARKETKPD